MTLHLKADHPEGNSSLAGHRQHAWRVPSWSRTGIMPVPP